MEMVVGPEFEILLRTLKDAQSGLYSTFTVSEILLAKILAELKRK